MAGSRAKRSMTSSGRSDDETMRSSWASSQKRRGAPAISPASASAISNDADLLRSTVKPRCGFGSCRREAAIFSSVAGPTPEPTFRECPLEFVDGGDAQLAGDAECALRSEPERAAVRDERGLHFRLQRAELVDLAGLD